MGCFANNKLTLLQVNFCAHQENLLILLLVSINERIFRREVLILYSSKSTIFILSNILWSWRQKVNCFSKKIPQEVRRHRATPHGRRGKNRNWRGAAPRWGLDGALQIFEGLSCCPVERACLDFCAVWLHRWEEQGDWLPCSDMAAGPVGCACAMSAFLSPGHGSHVSICEQPHSHSWCTWSAGAGWPCAFVQVILWLWARCSACPSWSQWLVQESVQWLKSVQQVHSELLWSCW